ncbi:MAG: ATP-binding protein [Bacteroidales bacterium]|nr:ATP-binding protein [Bacteroidales bacterium]
MSKLSIINFGPIKNAEFEFKKVNVLIGQQGAGKSCVLKIAAFCMWLEKVYFSGEIIDLQRDISSKKFVEKYFLKFYKIDEFIRLSETKISYIDGDQFKVSMDFDFNGDNWLNVIADQSLVQQKRIAYIPAERCLVSAVPNLMELRLPENNIFKYIVDWDFAHKQYTSNNKLNILGLNADFFYDEATRTDFISFDDNGVTQQIRFSNAASGLQSVVPVLVLTKAYLGQGKDLSIRERQRLKDLHILDDYNNSALNCNIFLEEPEENIFPEIQYQLMKFLFSALNNGGDNSLFVATHSPYTLTVTNNLIYAAKVGKIKREKVGSLVSEVMWLPSENVAAYFLTDGKAVNIVDDELGEIDPEHIDKISQVINHEYDQIRNIEYETE